MTNHFTSPFAEEMYNKIKNGLLEYEVIINHWPQSSLILENAVADVERAIIRALEKQYNDRHSRKVEHACPEANKTLGIVLNTMKRILDVLHNKVEDMLKCWAPCLPATGDKKSVFGEQMNAVTVLLRTKYKIHLQAIVGKFMNNMQANRCTRLKRILEEMTVEDGEPEIRERMQTLRSQLIDTASNLQEVFASQIFVSLCRGLWDTLGQTLDDIFASQMQRLMGNAQEKDMELPRSVLEARSILCKQHQLLDLLFLITPGLPLHRP